MEWVSKRTVDLLIRAAMDLLMVLSDVMFKFIIVVLLGYALT
jgi:hypothetical protein